MPSEVSDPREARDILANLELHIRRLRFTAGAHDLIGKESEATAFHTEADKLQNLLDLLRTTAECSPAGSA